MTPSHGEKRLRVERTRRKFRVRDVSVVVGIIATIVSVSLPLHDLATQQRKANEDAEKTSKILKSTSLVGIIQLLNRDAEIKIRVEKFLRDFPTDESVTQKMRSFVRGSEAYRSSDFSDLRAVGSHYEVLGALARKEYVDIDLIFSIVNFPDEFWKRTASFRDMIRLHNWNGPGQPQADFWENFQWLSAKYEKLRTASLLSERSKGRHIGSSIH